MFRFRLRSVSYSMAQMETSGPALAVGRGFTETVAEALAVHRNESVMVTVYPVEAVGETVMHEVVGPGGFQAYVPPPVAQRVDELPLHIGEFPLIVAIGTSIITHTESDAVPQPVVIVIV